MILITFCHLKYNIDMLIGLVTGVMKYKGGGLWDEMKLINKYICIFGLPPFSLKSYATLY